MNRLDMGCGAGKAEGFLGADIIAAEGVDYVFDFDSDESWPIEDDFFDYVRANHVVEHIHDVVHFFRELHRICRNGAIVHLETPHYSSSHSWQDPTHVNHFSFFFSDAITDGYLSRRIPKFELVSRSLSYGSFLHSWPARLYVAVFGMRKYEQYCAWRHPARNIALDLRVRK